MDSDCQQIINLATTISDRLAQKDQAITLLQHQVDAAAGTVTFPDLEASTWLVAPGTAGNTPGSGSTMTPSQAQPGIQSAWLGITPNGPYANGYFYKKLGPAPAKTRFTYELSFLFGQINDASASQAVELDIQQVISGTVYNMGWQFDFADGSLRVWNRNGKAWVTTGQPCPRWLPGAWMRIVAEQHRDGTSITHDAITINGVRSVVNLSFQAPTLSLPDMLNCAVQLDGNKAGAAYKLYLDRVRFTAQ